MSPDQRTQCALCGREDRLCDSHVIPEFIYKPLYSARRRMVGFLFKNGEIKRRYLQKGLREKLLCAECEELLNTRYEQPSLSYWRTITSFRSCPPPSMSMSMVEGGPLGLKMKLLRFRGFDYDKFKLFLISILWRSSVSTLPEFWQVRLGQHEERLRAMLLSGNPGARYEYPLWLCPVMQSGHGGVAAPFKFKYEGHCTYQFQLGRIAVLFCVSSHLKSDNICSLAPGPDGRLGALCLRPRELPQLWQHLKMAAGLYREVGS